MRQHITWSARAESPYSLNLSEGFKPFESAVELKWKASRFHGGEPHFQITSDLHHAALAELIITCQYKSPDDLFLVVIAADAAKRAGFQVIRLVLPYFPGARQDRVCNPGEALTVKVFADMINSCGFQDVVILSPHSEVTPALLNNVTILDELPYIEDIIADIIVETSIREYNIVCPDAGAGKRVGKVIKHLANTFPKCKFNLIRCEKIRDVSTGELKEFFVSAGNLHGHPTLIVDDINSMGGTFIGLTKKLREVNAGLVMLFTSHSDCVAGIHNVIDQLDHVYTTDSHGNWEEFETSTKFTGYEIELILTTTGKITHKL